MGIAHAIGMRMTIKVTRSQTNRAVPFIVVAIHTLRVWVVSTPTPRFASLHLATRSDPCLVPVTFSPAVSHGSPHHASRKADTTEARRMDVPQPRRWFKSGARNHLQANRSLGFCFEILI